MVMPPKPCPPADLKKTGVSEVAEWKSDPHLQLGLLFSLAGSQTQPLPAEDCRILKLRAASWGCLRGAGVGG